MIQNMISCEDVCHTGLGLGLGSQGMCGDEPRSGGMRKKPCLPSMGLEPSLSLGLRTMEDSIDLQCQGSPQSDVSSFCNSRVKREMELSEERVCRRVVFDEDEDANARKKLRLTKEQSALLENSFKENTTLSPKQKLALAKQLNLRPRQVEVWFQNRRARTKLKQTEVDCEYLKNCCEFLTKENKRLQKELNELKAQKVTPQLYMHVPAATLTICPSCERISGGGIENTSAKVSYTAAKKPHLHNTYNRSSATC